MCGLFRGIFLGQDNRRCTKSTAASSGASSPARASSLGHFSTVNEQRHGIIATWYSSFTFHFFHASIKANVSFFNFGNAIVVLLLLFPKIHDPHTSRKPFPKCQAPPTEVVFPRKANGCTLYYLPA